MEDGQNSLDASPRKPGTLQLCVDVPHDVKVERSLYIARPPELLCPYVDGLRERYWRWKLHLAAKSQPEPRILMLCGANHLYSFAAQPISFPEQLIRAGYVVTALDLRKLV